MRVTLPFSPTSNFAGPEFPLRLQLVDRRDDRTTHFQLRRRSYEEIGVRFEDLADVMTDRFDDATTTLLVEASLDNQLVGTMRVSFSFPPHDVLALPCEPYYSEVPKLKAEAHGIVVELSKAGIEPSMRNTSFRTTIYASLVRCGILCCEAVRASVVLVATRAQLRPFYEFMLGLREVAAPALYPPGDEPIVLLGGRFEEAAIHRRRHNRFFETSRLEVAAARSAIAALLPGRAVLVAQPDHKSSSSPLP